MIYTDKTFHELTSRLLQDTPPHKRSMYLSTHLDFDSPHITHPSEEQAHRLQSMISPFDRHLRSPGSAFSFFDRTS